VKSGEIAPHVPEWQQNIERKKYEKEQQQQWKEMRKQAKEIERQEKQRERELKRQAMEIEKEEKQMEIEEQLFEDELRKIEKILKFEEDIKIKRAERHRRHGLTKWELLYYDKSNPERHSYDFRHKLQTDHELID
jgi:hypothetical protein